MSVLRPQFSPLLFLSCANAIGFPALGGFVSCGPNLHFYWVFGSVFDGVSFLLFRSHMSHKKGAGTFALMPLNRMHSKLGTRLDSKHHRDCSIRVKRECPAAQLPALLDKCQLIYSCTVLENKYIFFILLPTFLFSLLPFWANT